MSPSCRWRCRRRRRRPTAARILWIGGADGGADGAVDGGTAWLTGALTASRRWRRRRRTVPDGGADGGAETVESMAAVTAADGGADGGARGADGGAGQQRVTLHRVTRSRFQPEQSPRVRSGRLCSAPGTGSAGRSGRANPGCREPETRPGHFADVFSRRQQRRVASQQDSTFIRLAKRRTRSAWVAIHRDRRCRKASIADQVQTTLSCVYSLMAPRSCLAGTGLRLLRSANGRAGCPETLSMPCRSTPTSLCQVPGIRRPT